MSISGNPGMEVNGMAVSKAQQASVHRYVKSHYDRINVTVPKGQKDDIQAHASARGESVNGFIARAIMEAMERDTESHQNATNGGGGVSIPEDEKTPSESS